MTDRIANALERRRSYEVGRLGVQLAGGGDRARDAVRTEGSAPESSRSRHDRARAGQVTTPDGPTSTPTVQTPVPGCTRHRRAAMMRPMTDERAWFDSYPSDVPRSLAPYPKESLFTLLRNAVAGFPDRPALAFFGAHMTYAELLVGGRAVLRGARRARACARATVSA